MKKQLLTTTALVAAGMMVGAGAAYAQAAKPAKPTLTIGGWVEGIVGGAHQDEGATGVGNRVGWDSQYDSEFLFKGSATLDNGIRIRTQAELEGEVSGDQWDEAWMAISGSFGEIRVGSEDAVTDLMVTGYSGSWATGVGQNLALDLGDWLKTPTGHVRLTAPRLGAEDSNKISYFTPRIEGFQLGVSYLPSLEECQAGVSNSAVSSNVNCNSSIATTAGNAHNGWAVAANFDRKFDQVRVGLAGGYRTLKAPDRTGSETQASDGPSGWIVAGSVEYAGFKVAAGYKREMNDSSTKTSTNQDVLDLGARYSWGKNAVSVGYIYGKSEGDGTVAGDDKQKALLVAYRRTLGPGVQYRLNLWWADFEGENVATTDDNDGYAITTSVRIDF